MTGTQKLAVGLGGALLLVLAGLTPVEILGQTHPLPLLAFDWTAGPAFTAVGVLVAFRRPELPIGWLLLATTVLYGLSEIGADYSVLAYRRHHGTLPLGPLAVVLEPLWLPSTLALVLAIVLYPSGRLPSPGWRRAVQWLVLLTAIWCLAFYSLIAQTVISGTVRITRAGVLTQLDRPSGGWRAVIIPLDVIGLLTMFLTLLVWLIGQVVGYGRLDRDARLTRKWIIAGATVTFLVLIVNLLPYPFFSPTGKLSIADFADLADWALPLAMGVGILKYRLYEIDRIVSRTLSYALLTALLAGVFVGLVVLITDVLPFSSEIGVAASTLAVAALFNPLRLRVQDRVDRRFNRAHYDAQAVVDAFAARLRDTVELDAVQADLLATVIKAVEPARATVWLRGDHHSTKAQTPG